MHGQSNRNSGLKLMCTPKEKHVPRNPLRKKKSLTLVNVDGDDEMITHLISLQAAETKPKQIRTSIPKIHPVLYT